MDILQLNLGRVEPERPGDRDIRFQVALLATLVCVAWSLLIRFAFGAPLLPELLAHFIFAVSPISVVEVAVGLLGPFAKRLAFLACVALYGLALIGSAMAFLKLQAAKGGKLPGLWFAGFGLFIWVSISFVLIPLLGGGVLGVYQRQGGWATSLWMLTVSGIFALALSVISALYEKRPDVAGTNQDRLNRRRVIRAAGYTVIGVALYDIGSSLFHSWFKKGSGRVMEGDGVFPNITGLAFEITPTPDFYVVSKNPFDPEVDVNRWRLEIAGRVNTPLVLSYSDIRALPAVEQYATLECIDNKVGGDLIGNAVWRGVRLGELLDRAGLQDGVVDLVFRAADDYTDSIALDRATREGTILAYEMNGEPLTAAHGFPLRMIVPGIFGMKNVKWIERIEAVGVDYKGYWQRRGWDDRAEYKTMSRIDVPGGDVRGATTIAGIAFAGDRGISKVEVSMDGGQSWQDAEVKPALSPYSWVLWQREWTPDAGGERVLVVRATDGQGVTQTATRTPVAPDGASGHHRRTVRVSG